MVRIRKFVFNFYSVNAFLNCRNVFFYLVLKKSNLVGGAPLFPFTESIYWCLSLLLPGYIRGYVGNFFTDVVIQFFGTLGGSHKRDIKETP